MYEQESLKVGERLTLADMDLHEARLDELDVEGLLEFAKHIALNAS